MTRVLRALSFLPVTGTRRATPPSVARPLIAALLPVALAVVGVPATPANAACNTAAAVTTCDTAAPNPWTTRVGEGNIPAEDNRTVDVQSGAQIVVGNSNAISLRDGATVHVANGAVVRNAATNTSGLYNTAGNTIEFRNNGTLTVDQGGQVIASGTQGNAEAVNLQGSGNTVTNDGTIRATNAAAIWFQNTSGLNTIVNNETGVIQAGTGNRNVIGATGNGAVDFTNRGRVVGSLFLAGGNDTLRLFTGSTITGNFRGGAGTDAIFLSGDGEASLPGNMVGFESLTKNDLGTWTLTGTITGVTVSTVQEGTLVLTGNNSSYTGQVIVDPAGTLQARAQSLPPTVTDNGIVRFAQPDDGTYAGLLTGTGAVEKTGAGILTLAPTAAGGNTYSGGTSLNEGTVAVGADNVLGASAGGLTFNGGTLRFDDSFDLSTGRAITLNAPGGTIDTQGFTSTIAQGTSGAGALTKAGAGSLILTGNNAHAGGTHVRAGTLAVGDPSHPGAALSGGGDVTVSAAGTLGGYGSVTGDVTNSGTIGVANALDAFAGGSRGNFTINGALTNAGLAQVGGNGVGNNLTVNSYVGQGGAVALNTFLGTDGSASDRLVINGGSATGSSSLLVTNVGGPGAQTTSNGILVVQAVNGGTTDAAAFQQGNRVAAGAHEYLLFHGGVSGGATANNWYLRSTLIPGSEPAALSAAGFAVPDPPPLGALAVPLFRPEVPLYSAVLPMERDLALATLGTFHERQGAQSLLKGTGVASAGWGRLFGGHEKHEWSGTAEPEFDGWVTGMQAGLDLASFVSPRGDERDRLGVFVGYARAQGDVDGLAMGQQLGVGDLGLNAYSLGGYWTHLGAGDWYLDAVLMGTFFDGEASSDFGTGADADGTGVTASLEGGYPIPLGAGLSLEPQAQLIWQHVNLDDTSDAFSTVDYDTTDTFVGRVGGRLQGQFQAGSVPLQPYVKLNLWQQLGNDDEVTFAGTDVISTKQRTTAIEAGVGVVAQITESVGLYAVADYTTDVAGNDTEVIQGNLGIRVTW